MVNQLLEKKKEKKKKVKNKNEYINDTNKIKKKCYYYNFLLFNIHEIFIIRIMLLNFFLTIIFYYFSY